VTASDVDKFLKLGTPVKNYRQRTISDSRAKYSS